MTTKIIVEGFKSIGKRVEIEVRPLTILAGANSSGKSSLMQPLLLLKQTLEAEFEPGLLKLEGPHVYFTSPEQFRHRTSQRQKSASLTIGVALDADRHFETTFGFARKTDSLEVHQSRIGNVTRTIGMKLDSPKKGDSKQEVVRDRFWLSVVTHTKSATQTHSLFELAPPEVGWFLDLVHLPGLRGNPEREYPVAAVSGRYRGTFEKYTASIIRHWIESDAKELKLLVENLKAIGLGSGIDARRINGSKLELRVGRTTKNNDDFVSIADVGVGVSQTLPVLVALLAARKGQLVYIEQPEIHLHPKAQVALAGIIADAAKRGVLVVIETHSSLLLLAVQTLVAEGKLSSDLVKLHWFERDKNSGATHITSRDLDPLGRFGDWPEDFDDVSLEAQSKFLDAVTLAKRKA